LINQWWRRLFLVTSFLLGDGKMFFINELQKIRNDNSGKIAVFIDMDGVVADYRW